MFQLRQFIGKKPAPRLVVAKTLEPPAELAPRESQLIDQWVAMAMLLVEDQRT